MARRVLLVDPDFDQLGELAEGLRARGLTTMLADGVDAALERLRLERADVVLASSTVCQPGQLPDRIRADPTLAGLRCFALVWAPSSEGLPEDHLARGDLDGLVARIIAVPSRSTPPPDSTPGEVRGDLAQMPLTDLLQILSVNRRTGVLAVSTATGAGELRISEGEVVDAVYRKLEGKKALYRLVGEREGTFAFLQGGPPPLRRVHVATQTLMMEAMRQLDEVARWRSELSPNGEALLSVTSVPPSPEDAPLAEVDQDMIVRLQTPSMIDDILDDSALPDLEVLESLGKLVSSGRVRRIARSALVTQLVPDEKLPMIRAMVGKLARDGFSGAPRLAFAGTALRIKALAGALRRIGDAVIPGEPAGDSPMPCVLATLRLGEGSELDLLGVVVAPELAPFWSLVLPGTGLLVKLDATDSPELDAACAAVEVMVLDAAALLGDVLEADPSQVAALIRSALETAAGG